MGFTLKDVIPWGRNLEEYKRMFNLMAEDLSKNIVSCADGPASFNYQMLKIDNRVTSFDPIYQFSREEIELRIQQTAPVVLEQLSENKEAFNWEWYLTPENLLKIRMETMQLFLQDYEQGKEEGRYIKGFLPELPFSDASFDLALCSHFLFTYSDHVDFQLHFDSILEMARVALEVRIFPLIKINGEESEHLAPIEHELQQKGFTTERVKSSYNFQKGGNEFLKVWKILSSENNLGKSN